MDLVLTDVPDKIRSVTPVGRLGKSDHDIMIEIDNRRPKSKQQAATPIWSRANWEAIWASLDGVNWDEELSL